MTTLAPKEAALDAESFRTIADLAYRLSGLTLVEEKATMIQSRLRHRLRSLGLSDFSGYCALLETEAGLEERKHLISALTTNVSHFFREAHHFELMKDHLAPRLTDLRGGAPLRIWSAGCSNGQEALSAAMTCREMLGTGSGPDLRILGTDIDEKVISFARRGLYSDRQVEGIPPALLQKYFTPQSSGSGAPSYQASPEIAALIRYNTLNLLADWPIRIRFDLIFCRNVVIYFDPETQERLWPKFHKALSPEGLLFLGHSERISDPERFGFACVGPTTYRPL